MPIDQAVRGNAPAVAGVVRCPHGGAPLHRLLSSGTGTGQVSLTAGVVAANATQIAGAAVNTATAQLGVNVISAAGTAWNSGSILAKARRKANGEVEPETPEQEPRSPFDEPVLAPKDLPPSSPLWSRVRCLGQSSRTTTKTRCWLSCCWRHEASETYSSSGALACWQISLSCLRSIRPCNWSRS